MGQHFQDRADLTSSSSSFGSRFSAIFGTTPIIVAAPGRVNLIGEHTDYNDGFVMPCAIDFTARIAIAPRNDARLVLQSDEFPERFDFLLDRLPDKPSHAWCDNLLGVVHMLRAEGIPLSGANLLLHSEVPIGAGLSSSAAVEVGTALALLAVNQRSLPLPRVAQLAQRAENTFINAQVGIMDPFVSCLGEAGHALQLDCRSLAFDPVPLPPQLRLVICNTMVKHKHAGGEYNLRRQECEQGVELLKRWYPNISALRDVSAPDLAAHEAELPKIIRDRCTHVVHENDRVLTFGRALCTGDLPALAKLMRESHASLRDLYRVSCTELDQMVELAEGLPGFGGGRMTGGGFGGCTVNLVEAPFAETFAKEIAGAYRQKTGVHPDVYICSATRGAHIVSPNSSKPG
jgi:galactokinase